MSLHRGTARRDGAVRVATWHGEATTAYLTPGRGRPTRAAIEQTLDALRHEGRHRALTAALSAADAVPFLEAGFCVHERLHLLHRAVTPHLEAPPVDPPPRRARRADRPSLLAVDRAAFPEFWQLDEAGLDDALAATPSARLRVVDGDTGHDGIAGYAVTGRAGHRGYLQRLAVDPALQRRRIGTRLVADALVWLRRWGARDVLVNTQEDNAAALGLYRSLGFELQPTGLAVLRRELVEVGEA